MTDLTAREVVERLHQYDDLPSFPKINIHFLATAPGNEHLLKFMTEKPDNPIRFKGKRIGIVATHGVEETEVSIPRKWFEARGAVCHLVCGGRRERNHQPLYLRHPAVCRCDCRSTYLNAKPKGDTNGRAHHSLQDTQRSRTFREVLPRSPRADDHQTGRS